MAISARRFTSFPSRSLATPRLRRKKDADRAGHGKGCDLGKCESQCDFSPAASWVAQSESSLSQPLRNPKSCFSGGPSRIRRPSVRLPQWL